MKIYRNSFFAIIFVSIFLMQPSYSHTVETFEGMDANALKAGISKYILTKGGTIDHGDSYENNTIKAVEYFRTKTGNVAYIYLFNVVPMENSTKLELDLKISKSGTLTEAQSALEEKAMENISSSIKGRFLYGLGFDFEYYDSENGKIKAPKGHKNGIKLTTVKYDALKKGLLAGDVIIEINGKPTEEIPIKEFSTILCAKSLNDSVTLKYKRGNETRTVTLTPRLSTLKVF